MPECISVEEYMREVREDIDSPPTSNFVSKMAQCRQTVHDLEEVRWKLFTFLLLHITCVTNMLYEPTTKIFFLYK